MAVLHRRRKLLMEWGAMKYYYRFSNELYHHGVLGQRWGVRRYQNKDGTLTNEGKKHYAKEWAKDVLENSGGVRSYERSPADAFDDPNFKKIKKKLLVKNAEIDDVIREADKLLQDYRDNQTEFACIAGVNDALQSEESPTLRIVAESIWFYACEDGDQGYGNSACVWAALSDKRDEVESINRKYLSLENEKSQYTKQLVDELLGEYGSAPISEAQTVSESMTQRYLNATDPDLKATSYTLDDAMEQYPGDLDGLLYAKNFVNKLQFTTNNNRYTVSTVNNILDAVEEVNLGDKDIRKLTPEDFKKLNARLTHY